MRYKKCGSTRDITIDHIVPSWLIKRLHNFGIKKKKILPNNQKNYQHLCRPCNQKKAGKIDWEDPVVRGYFEKLVVEIQKKLNTNTRYYMPEEVDNSKEIKVRNLDAGYVVSVYEGKGDKRVPVTMMACSTLDQVFEAMSLVFNEAREQ